MTHCQVGAATLNATRHPPRHAERMQVELNASQRAVLEWVAEGAEGEGPSSEWKTSARALERRGLVTVTRPGGVFTAAITDVGRDFLRHAAKPSQTPRQTTNPTPGSKVPPQPTAEPDTPTTDPPDWAPPTRVYKAHPVVRSLRDCPVALPKDPEARARAVLAAHALVLEAQRAGFTIEGHDQPRKRQGGGHDPHTGSALVTIKTERTTNVVSIGEQLRQVRHTLTPDEEQHRKKNQYTWGIPTWDYEPTGRTFFRIPGSYNAKKFLETPRKPLVEYVPRVIDYIHAQEKHAAEIEEANRVRAEREAAAAAARLALDKRRAEYDTWEAVLVDRARAWSELTRLRAFVDAVRTGPAAETAADFLAWADDHIDALDPSRSDTWPHGDTPDLTHDERRHHGSYRENFSPQPWTGASVSFAGRTYWAGRRTF